MGLADPLKVRLHPSAILWLSVLGYLRPKIVLPFLLSAVLHELGHALALFRMGQPPREICFRLEGARMTTPPLSYRQELLCAMAGPAVSLFLGLTLPFFPMLGGYSLCLGLFNLLPLGSLDGGRMLRCILLLHLPEHRALRIFRRINIFTGLFLLLPGLLLYVVFHMGIWPLLISGLLCGKALTEGLL